MWPSMPGREYGRIHSEQELCGGNSRIQDAFNDAISRAGT